MAKYFLLTAGDNLYPERADGDWKKCYETYEEAKSKIKVIPPHTTNGIVKIHHDVTYYIDGMGTFDWYEIIDLRLWIDG
jgi:hypothetical protein